MWQNKVCECGHGANTHIYYTSSTTVKREHSCTYVDYGAWKKATQEERKTYPDPFVCHCRKFTGAFQGEVTRIRKQEKKKQ